MILIVGGAWQGKLEFARELCKDKGIETITVAEGRTDSYSDAAKCVVIHGFHEYIHRLLREGRSVEEWLDSLEQDNPDVVIISNELGCGIVPVLAEDRQWREVTGRSVTKIAKKSREVYRVVCGIADRIK
ncbi:bifunctional adenosylcobinamide kinase/adenosylcobinamide-phosphate guanylyltransferase [Clostridium sp. HBUAS56010]|uniref:bifunctional adenosylcobinamide kinase/adenosylcobinamide-phosphate guanylyltransferase n=1 Tax=Clostridium sp. HBUAS56010 TaxID=2571127 RepID=UPI0011783009|nr:bifunctional adenosylcobinamide kinase/adenosylcobinamide-phosphate guanylyltransferase [Clostridium sp. HBUAS56010]